MNGDVQQHYLAAEQAYGEGDFDQAEVIATALLHRLDSTTSSGAEQEACLAWRAFVALLLGHIYFHGLHQADKAEAHYQLVLASTPPDTLRDLAQQGLERCRALADQADPPDPVSSGSAAPIDGVSMSTTTPSSALNNGANVESHLTPEQDLIRDPFITTCSGATSCAPTSHGSAAPWLQTVGVQTVEQNQNDGSEMESMSDAPAVAFEAPVNDSGDAATPPPTTPTNADRDEAEADQEAIDDDPIPLTAASSNGERSAPRNIAQIHQDVARKDINQVAQKEAPAAIEGLLSKRTQASPEHLDLSPWLLRRTINFNKR